MNIKSLKQVSKFFVVTFVITWGLWSSSVLSARGMNIPTFLLILSMMASFTPTITALILERKEKGKEGFKKQWKTWFHWSFSKAWLIWIPLFFFGTGIMTYFLLQLMVPDFEAVNSPPLWMTPLIFLQIFFIGGALGEELGWRGYAYPRLKQLMSPIKATFLLGVIWSLWHLPLFYMVGTVQSNIPMWEFMLQNTLMAFFYTGLYKRTKGSIWMMFYLHAVANTVAAVIPYWQNDVGRILGFLILLIGCIVLFFMDSVVDRHQQEV